MAAAATDQIEASSVLERSYIREALLEEMMLASGRTNRWKLSHPFEIGLPKWIIGVTPFRIYSGPLVRHVCSKLKPLQPPE